MKLLEVVPHDPQWRAMFKNEEEHIANALGENIITIHHIGSTAIPNIYAKPVIDILVEVKSINDVDLRSSVMELLGYEVMGEFGIAGRRYFRKDDAQRVRTHQIHTFETGSPEIERHLMFRDHMIAIQKMRKRTATSSESWRQNIRKTLTGIWTAKIVSSRKLITNRHGLVSSPDEVKA